MNNFGQMLAVLKIFNENSKMNKISLCNIFIEGKEADVSWITFKSPKAE